MFEKVNPSHPDKVADRIAGAMVDLAYTRSENPKVAVEVLLGHGYAYIIAESSVSFTHEDVEPIVQRITGKNLTVRLLSVPQNEFLAANQRGTIKCGDNGIFKGCPIDEDQRVLTNVAAVIYEKYQCDGKYIIDFPRTEWPVTFASGREMTRDVITRELTICQSHAPKHNLVKVINEAFAKHGATYPFDRTMAQLNNIVYKWPLRKINPLGYWTGGPDVDCGATNRKLGSDMGDGVTGGGLHGKDLSKADVSVNIVCHLKAMATKQTVKASCAIGDEDVIFEYQYPAGSPVLEKVSYSEVVREAREYIDEIGGFEKFAEWGLIRPENITE